MNELLDPQENFNTIVFLKQTKKLTMQYKKCHILLGQPRTNNGTERKLLDKSYDFKKSNESERHQLSSIHTTHYDQFNIKLDLRLLLAILLNRLHKRYSNI